MKNIIAGIILACVLMQCSPQKNQIAAVQITGTPINLQPPAGFELQPDLGGFRHKEKMATIMVVTLSRMFDDAVKDLNKDNLSSQGIKLVSKENIKVNNGTTEGVLCLLDREGEEEQFLQWLLLVPDKNVAISINGTFPKNDKALSDPIRQALLTTTITPDTGSSIDLSILPFKIDVTGMKPARLAEGPAAIFTRDGSWSENAMYDLSFFAAGGTIQPGVYPDAMFAEEQLMKVCANCVLDRDNIHTVTTDSLQGFELWAYVTDSINHTSRLKYEKILFDTADYYLMLGTATNDHAEALKQFQTISNTFRRTEVKQEKPKV